MPEGSGKGVKSQQLMYESANLVRILEDLQPEQIQIFDSRETEIPSSFKAFPGHALKAEKVQLHRSKPNQSVG